MSRIQRANLVLLIASMLASVTSLSAQAPDDSDAAPPEERAQAAAETWLGLVWSGELEESWEEASALFRQNVTAEQWAQASDAVAAQTGSFEDRTLLTAEASDDIPNAPPGEYMMLTYSSDFERAEAREIVTMILEDGEWKAIGYFVTPP